MDSSEFKKLVADVDFDLLTDWEQEFLESVESKLQKNLVLTKIQTMKVREICDESGDRNVKSSLWPTF